MNGFAIWSQTPELKSQALSSFAGKDWRARGEASNKEYRSAIFGTDIRRRILLSGVLCLALGNPRMSDGGVAVPNPESPRLIYRRIGVADFQDFHRLVTEPSIRKYLMDGEVMEESWTMETIETSGKMFQDRGIGLWLVVKPETGKAIGFCGFFIFQKLSSEPQLLYALTESQTGRGYATEIAKTLCAIAKKAGADNGFLGHELWSYLDGFRKALCPPRCSVLTDSDMQHVLRKAGLQFVEAAIDEPNRASARVLEKAGFVLQGEAPERYQPSLRLFAVTHHACISVCLSWNELTRRVNSRELWCDAAVQDAALTNPHLADFQD